MEDQKNSKFIGENISVGFKKDPLLKKVPISPDYFEWREEHFTVVFLLSQWADMARRGSKAKNMRPAHLTRAEKMGSWGVGRFYFKVAVECGRVFVLYYDRTPKKADAGEGQWILFQEIM